MNMRAREFMRVLAPIWTAPTTAKTHIFHDAILPSLKTTLICFAVCAWEFSQELLDPTACNAGWLAFRTWLVILPQFLLVVAFILQCCRLHRNTRGRAFVVTTILTVLVPLGFVAVIHSAFRVSLSLCCCSSLLCPLSMSNQLQDPSTKACSNFFHNCNWALVRKVTHFASTIALLSPLIALRSSNYLVSAREQEAKDHITQFTRKFK